MNMGLSYCALILAFIILTIYTVTNITILAINPLDCCYSNIMGGNMTYYILILSTSNIIFILILLFTYAMYIPGQTVSNISMITYVIINYVIGIIWLIIGEAIIFKDSNRCVLNGSIHIMYASLVWISPLYHVLRTRCEKKPKAITYANPEGNDYVYIRSRESYEV